MSSKQRKRSVPQSTPDNSSSSENNDAAPTLELILAKLDGFEAKLDTSKNEVITSIRSEIVELRQMITSQGSIIDQLHSENTRLQSALRAEVEDKNRFFARIEQLPNIDGPFPMVEQSINELLTHTAIDPSFVSDIQIIRPKALDPARPRKPFVLLRFTSIRVASALLFQSKKIWQEKKISVSRVLSKWQQSEMNDAIDKAKTTNPDAKIHVNRSIPCAYVGNVRVWPLMRAGRHPSISYSQAVDRQQKFIDDLDTSSLRSVDSFSSVTGSLPAVNGHEFYGVLVHWDGDLEKGRKLVHDISTASNNPFIVGPKDNVIHAGIAMRPNGQLEVISGDGGERNAALNLLSILGHRKQAGVLVVILRKYGGFNLGPTRYRYFNELANLLLDKISG